MYKRQTLSNIGPISVDEEYRDEVEGFHLIILSLIHILLEFAGGDFAVVVSACLVVVIRLLATRYCWNLPKATKKKKEVV